MTITENELAPNADNNADSEPTSQPEVRNATYLELAKATWKLAYRLAYTDNVFCAEGTNEYLRAFNLPELVHAEGNEELKDKYLDAWHNFTNWTTLGNDVDPEHDAHMRQQLARRIRTRLQREEPKPVATMNQWLTELGLDPFAPPRHVGSYHIEHAPNATVNSERIARALNAMFPEVEATVSYRRRVQ